MTDDYMSDDFLKQLEEEEKKRKDVLPPSIQNQRKRQKKQEEIQKEQKKSLKERQEESRNEGLAKSLSEENKGFLLLKKMGYTEGAGLGRDQKGITEPIPLVVKVGRFGVGRDDVVQEKKRKLEAELEENVKNEEQHAENRQGFVERMSQKYQEKQMLSTIRECRIICEQLDRENDIERKDFWLPPKVVQDPLLDADLRKIQEYENQHENPFEEFEPSVQLSQITDYLRSKYFFCIWCGEAYGDLETLDRKCPGNDSELH